MITVGWTIYRDRFWDHLVSFALNRQEVMNTPLASSDDSSVIQMIEQDVAKLPP